MTSPLDDGHKEAVASFVINTMPAHDLWCEPWFRMGEVFFRKKPSRKEIVNDPDNAVVNFYLMVRSRWEQLHFLMEGTLHCDFLSRLADRVAEEGSSDELYRAWAFWLQYSRAFVSPDRWSVSDLLPGRDCLQSDAQRKVLAHLSQRLSGVYLSDRDPYEVIRQADSAGTLFYLCPPDKRSLILLEPLLRQLRGSYILHTTEAALMKKMAARLGLYTDADSLPLGIYTSFVRQPGLFG